MVSLTSITRQSLPDEEYLKLLGIAICVFNSNNAFVIENLLKLDTDGKEDWYKLIDKESGQLQDKIHKFFCGHAKGSKVEDLFCVQIVPMRNRIIHGFQITVNEEQILATKYRKNDKKHPNEQFYITKEYLFDFIEKNQQLSDLLHEIRGY